MSVRVNVLSGLGNRTILNLGKVNICDKFIVILYKKGGLVDA
jgi:hypothetical protein